MLDGSLFDPRRSRDPRIICTLGMHRSGTSLVSRMLNLLGVHLGPLESISATGDDNVTGFWEHVALGRLNDEILARFGGRWDEPPVFPPSWPVDPRLADLVDAARRIVADDFASHAVWGWKDPRTCLTLPFWQHVLGPMRYVIVVRNPAAVVASLMRRNGMSVDRAERLWLAHMQGSLAHTSGQPRTFVFYEEILADWPPQLRRLAAFAERSECLDDPVLLESVGTFVDDELCHHRVSMEELAGDVRLSFPTLSLYLAVRAYAPRGTENDEHGNAGNRSASVDASLDLIGARAVDTWDRAAEAHGYAATLAGLRAERHDLVEALAAARADLQLAHIDRDAERSRRAAIQKEQDTLQASVAWRSVAAVRHVIERLLPPGTRRRRMWSAMIRPIARRLPGPRSRRPAGHLRPV